MKRTLTLLTLAVSGTTLLNAQSPFKCGADRARQEAIANDPSILEREAELEQWIRDYVDAHAGERADDTTLVIPMVFHVLHMNGPENISDEQIFDAVRILNEDYNLLNSDANTACCGFESIEGNIHLEFRLATKDPLGNCTNGIDRIQTIETFQGDNGSKLNPWYRDRYLNVWTCDKMEDGVAGYAYYPGTVSGGLLALADGVIILHDYVGSIGTSSPGTSRALTHEIGHWLDLSHPWGSTNDPGVACGDDGVDDTPITKGWAYCPAPTASRVCDPAIYENFQNFMDYSYCSMMFTEGQKLRMRAALASNTSGRSNLWSAANLQFTGTETAPGPTCTPVAAFYPEDRYICQGASVRFHDNHARATPTAWEWTFQDGTPSTSTAQNPLVTFNTPGWKTVTLTVTNSAGSDTRTDEFAVLVTDSWPERPGLLYESFEDPSNYYQWIAENWDMNLTAWQRVEGVGHTGNACVVMNGYNHAGPNDFLIDDGGGDIDELVSPSLDLSNISGMQLTFWYAYTTQTGSVDNMSENLQVYFSSDCGESWILRTTIDEEDLITNGASGAYYVPSGPTEWKQATVSLGPSFEDPNVRLKFVYNSSEFSNNIYVDDIQISGVVSVPEIGQAPNMAIYPNPANGGFTVNYALSTASAVELTISDMSGRLLLSRAANGGSMGRMDLDSRELGLAAGSYLVSLRAASGTTVQRFTVQ